ncbi:SGNH/GDSL hydrolase family protein [bacterium]|nr:SGNH/GDSL hydrolase family protein [bacterium]
MFRNLALLIGVVLLCLIALEFSLPLIIDRDFVNILYREDHSIGFLPLPNQKIRSIQDKVYKTNNYGFRDSDWDAVDKTKTRIGYIGDSVTFGMGVSDTEIFPSLLDSMLANENAEVYNFGVGRYATPNYYGILQSFADSLKLDAVVICFLLNDYFVETNEPYIYIEAKSGRWARKSTSSFGVWFRWQMRKSAVISFAYLAYLELKRQLSGSSDKRTTQEKTEAKITKIIGWKDSFKLQVGKIVELCDKAELSLTVCIIPTGGMIEGPNVEELQFQYQTMVDVFNQSGVKYFDLKDIFTKDNYGEYFHHFDVVHPNEKGHRYIAGKMYPIVMELVEIKDDSTFSNSD